MSSISSAAPEASASVVKAPSWRMQHMTIFDSPTDVTNPMLWAQALCLEAPLRPWGPRCQHVYTSASASGLPPTAARLLPQHAVGQRLLPHCCRTCCEMKTAASLLPDMLQDTKHDKDCCPTAAHRCRTDSGAPGAGRADRLHAWMRPCGRGASGASVYTPQLQDRACCPTAAHCCRTCRETGTAAGCAAGQRLLPHCCRTCCETGTAAGCAARQRLLPHCCRTCCEAETAVAQTVAEGVRLGQGARDADGGRRFVLECAPAAAAA